MMWNFASWNSLRRINRRPWRMWRLMKCETSHIITWLASINKSGLSTTSSRSVLDNDDYLNRFHTLYWPFQHEMWKRHCCNVSCRLEDIVWYPIGSLWHATGVIVVHGISHSCWRTTFPFNFTCSVLVKLTLFGSNREFTWLKPATLTHSVKIAIYCQWIRISASTSKQRTNSSWYVSKSSIMSQFCCL